jgi:hypothetical protein
MYWDIGASTLISSIWINIGISGQFTPMIPQDTTRYCRRRDRFGSILGYRGGRANNTLIDDLDQY